MTTIRRPAPARTRGTTLIEAMVSLTILLVGILGMMQMQVFGITSNAGARSQTQALQLARELAASLEQLSPDDVRIADHFTGDNPPPEFGHLIVATDTLAASGFTTYSDGLLLGGVTTDAEILAEVGGDAVDPTLPRYQRRWQVWAMTTAAAAAGVKGIAVSVTYREPRLPVLREVVLLTQVSNKGLSSAFASAYR